MTIKVYQRDRLIGTVPDLQPKSNRFIFQVRPSDFIPRQQDGETVLDAHWSICPGDFACIEGWQPIAADLLCSDTSDADLMEAMAIMAGLR